MFLGSETVKKCVLFLTIAAALCLTGCGESLDKYEFIFDRYYAATLKVTTSTDILATTQDPDIELLSQSESIVAVWGKEGKMDRTHWFNMIAFDEEAMTAARKYGFILEETTSGINNKPTPALRFDAEMVIGTAVLDAPYANNNEKQIAVLKAAFEAYQADARELTYDSAQLTSSTMMVNQAINAVLAKLMQSPGYAAHLSRLKGLEFDHMTLEESYMRMLIEDDIVKIKIKCGKAWFKKGLNDYPFEDHPDVQYM
jgi:hypothetical protein